MADRGQRHRVSTATGRILLVEDEVNLARGIRENLEAEGYVVEVVVDGQTGLNRIPRPSSASPSST